MALRHRPHPTHPVTPVRRRPHRAVHPTRPHPKGTLITVARVGHRKIIVPSGSPIPVRGTFAAPPPVYAGNLRPPDAALPPSTIKYDFRPPDAAPTRVPGGWLYQPATGDRAGTPGNHPRGVRRYPTAVKPAVRPLAHKAAIRAPARRVSGLHAPIVPPAGISAPSGISLTGGGSGAPETSSPAPADMGQGGGWGNLLQIGALAAVAILLVIYLRRKKRR